MDRDSFSPPYLEAKRSIDDRAIDLRVWRKLAERLASLSGNVQELSVLEVGAGTGAMIDRLAPASELATGALRYLALEPDAENAAQLRQRFGSEVEVVEESLFEYASAAIERGERWRLIVACAVMDLLPLERASRSMAALLASGGLLYLPICFDGVTAFEPEIDPDVEREIERCYHETMRQRRHDGESTGGASSGRKLFGALRSAGLEIVAAGGSDWVVFADRDGRYPQQEAAFLHRLVDTVERVVRPRLPGTDVEGWAKQRREQIERGELVYIAHQLDLLAAKP